MARPTPSNIPTFGCPQGMITPVHPLSVNRLPIHPLMGENPTFTLQRPPNPLNINRKPIRPLMAGSQMVARHNQISNASQVFGRPSSTVSVLARQALCDFQQRTSSFVNSSMSSNVDVPSLHRTSSLPVVTTSVAHSEVNSRQTDSSSSKSSIALTSVNRARINIGSTTSGSASLNSFASPCAAQNIQLAPTDAAHDTKLAREYISKFAPTSEAHDVKLKHDQRYPLLEMRSSSTQLMTSLGCIAPTSVTAISSSQKYSAEDIEFKKQEALRKRKLLKSKVAQ